MWRLTLAVAILALTVRTGESYYALVAAVATVCFYLLDTYYQAIERSIRISYDTFVSKLHRGDLEPDHLFRIDALGVGRHLIFKIMNSASLGMFYISILFITLVPWYIVVIPKMSAILAGTLSL